MATASFRNRESVIQAILRRERDGLPLNCEAIKDASRPLHSGAMSSLRLMAQRVASGRHRSRHGRTQEGVGQSEDPRPIA